MRVKIIGGDVYIPEFNDNKELPEAEQIKCHYKHMSVEQDSQFTRLADPEFDSETREMATTIKFVRDDAGIVAASWPKIENCCYDLNNGKAVEIESGADLLKAPKDFRRLFDELLNEAFARVNAVDKKKLK